MLARKYGPQSYGTIGNEDADEIPILAIAASTILAPSFDA